MAQRVGAYDCMPVFAAARFEQHDQGVAYLDARKT